MFIKKKYFFKPTLLIIAAALICSACAATTANRKTMRINAATPKPNRFVVRGTALIDLARGNQPVFFRGMGYSPYLPQETPLYGDAPGNDDRYDRHLELIRDLGANYLHVFPRLMPPKFFEALDQTDLVYGQDVWIWAYADDLLDPEFRAETMTNIKEVIDHTYRSGRPDRLVLFSIGDELQASAVVQTNRRHPDVTAYSGKHISVSRRTPAEVAMAMLVDEAMEYELTTYGRRHLYCHTSWTHIGPVADRPDLELEREHVLVPDMGDLTCMNIYTYANGVGTSPAGSVTGTTYQGYLEQLARETDQPILITQVGLSTSPIEPKPDVPGFGGHKVPDVAQTFRSVWEDIRTAEGKEKFSGLVFFELQDEWWKSGDNPTDFKTQESDDPEEWFGIYTVGEENRLIPKGDIPATIKELFTAP